MTELAPPWLLELREVGRDAIIIPKIVETIARMPRPKSTPSTRSLRIFNRRGGSGPNSGVTVGAVPVRAAAVAVAAPGAAAAALAARRRARRLWRGASVKAWCP